MKKDLLLLFFIGVFFTVPLFAQESDNEDLSEKKEVIFETDGEFSQSFNTGLIGKDISKTFDSEAFESISEVKGNATIIFGAYGLSLGIQDKLTTYYLTDTNIMAYKNKATGIVGNNIIFNSNFRFFINFEAIYEITFIPSSPITSSLQLAPAVGVKFEMDMFEFQINQKMPFTIDINNSALSLIEIDGLYKLAFHTGIGFGAGIQYNLVAPVDPRGFTSATPEQTLKIYADWPLKSFVPEAGLLMFNDSNKLIWGFYAGVGITNDFWKISGGYSGGYNLNTKTWENLFTASFSITM